MKKCIPCGAEAVVEAQTCANCGEGSWSVSIASKEHVPEMSESKIVSDKLPDTDPNSFNSDNANSSSIVTPAEPASKVSESNDELSDKPIDPVGDSVVESIPKRRRPR